MAGKKSAQGQATKRECGVTAVTRWKNQDQLEFDIEFYDHILERNPDQVEVLRVQGELLSRRGLHRRALKVDQRLVELRPLDGVAHYNLACSLALLGQSEEALAELWQAFEVGYDDVVHLESDPDLESVRELPGYQDLLQTYGNLANQEQPLTDSLASLDDSLEANEFIDLGTLDLGPMLGYDELAEDDDDDDFDDDDVEFDDDDFEDDDDEDEDDDLDDY